MTKHKHLKQLVRERMRKTGESYATARRQTIRHATDQSHGRASPSRRGAARFHFPGNVPATTALRVVLTQAGALAPHTGLPFSEAMLFGIAGGIGVGVFSFYYEKENFSSFFIAGRHSWQDDVAYCDQACRLLGVTSLVRESSGAKAADTQLRELLSSHRACIAWVDMAHLPHRCLPAQWSGGGYHVVTVYELDPEHETALIGDLTEEPIPISLAALAQSRARIKKQKHRLLSLEPGEVRVDLRDLVRAGLANCFRGMGGEGWKNYKTNFSLRAFQLWAARLHGSKDNERWERIFAPGQGLWRGLTGVHDFIEHYGTGGGLCRPIFADFLSEAAEALSDPALRGLAERYASLGRGWSEVADAALPDHVPEFREAKELLARKAELNLGAAEQAREELPDIWRRLNELASNASRKFPLDAEQSSQLRLELQARVQALHEAEVAGHLAIGSYLA